jgi:hypothetical protein
MAKKTTVKITGISQARDNALKFINSTTKDREFLDFVGQTAADQIRSAVRAGGRTDPAYFQPPLEDSTVDRRKTLIKQGNSFDQKIVNPNRSNLSMSGQLLDSIYFRINESISTVVLLIKKQRNPYKGKSGQPLENKDNVEIKDDLEKRGFKFFFISEKLNTLLENKITQQLRRKLSLYNKIVRKLK